MTSASLFALIPALVGQPLEINALTEWLPLEIEQGVYRLYFNPPTSTLHSFPHQV